MRRLLIARIRGRLSEFFVALSSWRSVLRQGMAGLIGASSYYDVEVKGRVIKDAVWYYDYPTAESALIAGRLCFYNEKVDVFVDGVKEEK